MLQEVSRPLSSRFEAPLLLTLLATAGYGCRQEETSMAQDPPASSPAPSPPADASPQNEPWYASGLNGAIATAKRKATDAGLKILQEGGNAADAAAAAILALSVADHDKFHLGGEVVLMVYDAKTRAIEVIAGQGVAPRLATRERFAREKGGIPAEGVLAAAVPGAPDALLTLLDRHGTRTWKEVVAPTEELLKKYEKPWHSNLSRILRLMTKAEKDGSGDRRRGLHRAADEFYRGKIAREIAEWSEKNGGLIRYVDLSTHATRIEEPSVAEYHGFKLYKPGAWTQGPALLQAVTVLDYFSFKGLSPFEPRNVHLPVEAVKLAFADRDTYYGDPLFVDVPMEGLLSTYYGSLRRKIIDIEKASLAFRPGDPVNKKAEPDDKKIIKWAANVAKANDTTTCVVADKEGNIVAATPSGWAGVEAGRTGIFLATRLQSFNLWDGHPNVIEPGKRPRITLTPTLVTTKEGAPFMAVSVAGGDAQDQVSLQMLMNVIDHDMAAADAVKSPRWASEHMVGSFKQTAPRLGVLTMDPALIEKTGPALTAMGHKLEPAKTPIGEPVVLVIDPITRIISAAGDPAAGREAGAY
jgi:gamma-glutamyltranspeptidase/glutathione hydrolase